MVMSEKITYSFTHTHTHNLKQALTQLSTHKCPQTGGLNYPNTHTDEQLCDLDQSNSADSVNPLEQRREKQD